MPIVRPAELSDVSPMATILRAGFPPTLVDRTILGCVGFHRYLADTVAIGPRGGTLYVLVADAAAVLGVAEFRWSFDGILLNHIYVSPGRQGQGLGRMLLAEGIARTIAWTGRAAGECGICLDVFADNFPARRWYESIGFTTVGELAWLQRPLEPLGRTGRPWYLSGWPQAECAHAAYGFSEFELRTEIGRHRIGRLGTQWFRITDAAILSDATGLAALTELDPARRLLYFGPRVDDSPPQAISLRMHAAALDVLNRLQSRPAASGPEISAAGSRHA